MSRIILDMGSGNTSNNDLSYIRTMLGRLRAVDGSKHEVVIKWQLFEKAGKNKPLSHKSFKYAYEYAKMFGYETTASVFDLNSLKFLLKFDVPFIKVSCNKDKYNLVDHIPKGIKKYVSYTRPHSHPSVYYDAIKNRADVLLACVPKYPSFTEDYENIFSKNELKNAISDHTNDFKLFNEFKPDIVEWHFKLEDSTGLDAGSFARTPEQLEDILTNS